MRAALTQVTATVSKERMCSVEPGSVNPELLLLVWGGSMAEGVAVSIRPNIFESVGEIANLPDSAYGYVASAPEPFNISRILIEMFSRRQSWRARLVSVGDQDSPWVFADRRALIIRKSGKSFDLTYYSKAEPALKWQIGEVAVILLSFLVVPVILAYFSPLSKSESLGIVQFFGGMGILMVWVGIPYLVAGVLQSFWRAFAPVQVQSLRVSNGFLGDVSLRHVARVEVKRWTSLDWPKSEVLVWYAGSSRPITVLRDADREPTMNYAEISDERTGGWARFIDVPKFVQEFIMEVVADESRSHVGGANMPASGI